MSPIELQTERGKVTLCPMTDFQVQLASDEMIIVVIQYIETIEQFDSGQRKQLQTVLSAKQAFELGATLKKAARLIMESGSVSAN